MTLLNVLLIRIVLYLFHLVLGVGSCRPAARATAVLLHSSCNSDLHPWIIVTWAPFLKKEETESFKKKKSVLTKKLDILDFLNEGDGVNVILRI